VTKDGRRTRFVTPQVVLFTRDIERTVAFYRGAGFLEVFRTGAVTSAARGPSGRRPRHLTEGTTMTAIDSVTLEVPDPAAAAAFYDAAFGLGDRLQLRPAQDATSGFRGFTLSLVVSQPSTVDALVEAAVDAGATAIKPAAKSFWGYGGVLQAPDGAVWKVATSAKKDSGPRTRQVDQVVLLLGAAEVKASKRFYTERGLAVGKSFGSKYVEFASGSGRISLALYGRRALAKDAGVPPEGSGSHRIVVTGGTEPFTDPDGFRWEPAA
jgi:catechol 2,3-dioxygenase-like lactoylglutathione lyase family enzyme